MEKINSDKEFFDKVEKNIFNNDPCVIIFNNKENELINDILNLFEYREIFIPVFYVDINSCMSVAKKYHIGDVEGYKKPPIIFFVDEFKVSEFYLDKNFHLLDFISRVSDKYFKSHITIELERKKIEDNPFDLMLYFGMEIVREALFASRRFGLKYLPENVGPSIEKFNRLFSKISECYNNISYMSDMSIDLLKRTSFYYNNPEFDQLNDTIIQFERNMETKYTRCVPCHNPELERYTYRDKPEHLEHLDTLKKIADNTPWLEQRADFYEIIEVIENDNYKIHEAVMEYNRFNNIKKLIKDYNLTINDVEYMMSYRFGGGDIDKHKND